MKDKRCSMFIPYRMGLGVVGSGSAADGGAGVGGPVEAEVGSVGAVGAVMTASDEYDFFFPIPRDMNVTQEFGIRVRFVTASTTGSDTHTWIGLYDVIAEDAALAVGSTALDTTIAVVTDNGTASAWQDTARGIINGNTFTKANLTNSDFLAINIELDATDASEAINLLGIVIDYMPKRGLGGFPDFNAAFDQEDV